jgi:hypothetical protein
VAQSPNLNLQTVTHVMISDYLDSETKRGLSYQPFIRFTLIDHLSPRCDIRHLRAHFNFINNRLFASGNSEAEEVETKRY